VLFEAVRRATRGIARSMRLLFLYYLILKDRLFVLENPIVFGVFSAMIPYGTFRAVRENNQSVFILIGLIGEKPGVNFIASLIRGLFLLRSWSQFSR
jgi:hypothetical protein